jgi:hypothetical protein
MHGLIILFKLPFMLVWGGLSTARKVYRIKKRLETDAASILSPENARRSRLWLERFFKALAAGTWNLERLPGWLRTVLAWILPKTEVDNLLGAFGQALLKSSKIEKNDPALYEDIRETFTWRNPPKN